jgi:hypothetical protein
MGGVTSGRCRGSAISSFWRRWKLDERQNTKINSLSLVNNFFLSHLLLRLLNLQIDTPPTPPAEFLGDGVAQSIKAVQLAR